MNKIIDFSNGINDKISAEFIGDGFVAEANNAEYNHSPVLSKRYGVETFNSELDTAISNLGITMSNFWVWYPSNMPTDAIGDYVVVVYGSNKLYVMKKELRMWIPEQIIITDVTYISDSSLVAFIGNKFLISDGINKGHYIEVDKDGNLVYGILGIPAPIRKLVVSGAGADNESVSTADDEIDRGMEIERGNILQLVYTVEDKYGNESNPSPVSTYTNRQYRFPTPTDYAPFSYWWSKAKYFNFAIPEGLDSITEDSLEKFNVYRSDVRYTEGSAESVVFYKVATIDIQDVYIDTAAYGTREPSYEQDIAPVSKFISENSQVKFVANLKLKTVFPFDFRYFTEIKLTNNNNRSYINAPIAIQLNSEDIFKTGSFSGWSEFQSHDYWKDHIRIFDQDKTTPLPVVYFPSNNLYYILLPYIPENPVRSIYVSYDEYDSDWVTNGVSDTWKIPWYGQFINGANPVEWLTQKVFYPNRVRSSDTLVCCSNEDHTSDSVPNRADGGNGISFTGECEWAEEPIEYLDLSSVQNLLNFSSTDNNNVLKIRNSNTNNADNYAETAEISEDFPESGFHFMNLGMPDRADETMDWYELFRIYSDSSNYIKLEYRSFHVFGNNRITFTFRVTAYDGSGTPYEAWFDTDTLSYTNPTSPLSILFSWDASLNKVFLKTMFLAGNTGNYEEITLLKIPTSATGYKIRYSGAFPFHSGAVTTYYYFSQMYFGKNEYINSDDKAKQIMNFSPYFPEEYLGYTNESNENISFEDPTDNTVKDYKNFVKWSTVNGLNFPDLWERAFNEPIKGIIPLRRKTELAIDNRMLIFGRNTLNVFTLSGEPDSWYDSTNNIIEDYNQFGILAENSLGSLNGRIFWISEVGAMMFDDIPIPISMNKINIPIDEDMIGFAIPLRNQYAFHSQSTGKTYVYHLSGDSWTTFTGLNLTLSRILSGGSDTDNKNLFLNSSGLIKSYPSSSQSGFSTTVKTRKFTLDNNILRRFRTDFDGQISVSTEIQNRSTTLTQSFNDVDRMVFRGLSNGSFGEYIQFTLTDFTKLKKLEYEIQRR